MKLILLSIFLAVCHGVALAHLETSKDKPVPHFSMWNRLLLKSIANSNPKLFKDAPLDQIFRAPAPQAYPEHLYIDEYFVDARQLLTQAIKISKEAKLPELDWEERYDFCFWIWCFDFTLAQRSQDSQLIGTQTITTKTDVTPTTFKNVFHVPYFQWTSPHWTFNFTNNGYGDRVSYQGYHITVQNVTFTVTTDYEYVDNVGIQLSNFTIGYFVGNFTTRLDAYYIIDENGFVEKEGPIIYDATEYTMEDWEWAQGKYTSHLHRQLNCLLSNSLADPVACFPNEDKNYNAYYNFLMIELIQTMGLGALLS